MRQFLLVVCFFVLSVFNALAQCPFTVNAGPDTTICANQSAYLHGSVNPAGAYTYSWTPAATLTGANTLTPVASPTDTAVYVLSVTAGGCTATDTVKVNVSGSALVVNATVTPTLICPRQQVQLDASIVPTQCGPTPACNGNNISSVIGNGNTPEPGAATAPPSLLGNFNKSGRNQMLYTAAELNAALGGACTIKGLSFYLAIFNSNAYLVDFTISIGCTNQTTLSTFNNNLTTVFNPTTIQPSAANGGRNDFGFNTAYNWDGVSNLIVDVCWYDPGTFGNQNNKAQCTATGFNSMLYAFTNAGSLCGTTTVPTVTQLRPNIRFSFCQPDITNYNILWTPNTGTNTVSNPAIHNPTSNPATSQTYTIAVGSGNCIGYKSVSVTVDTSTVSAGPDISSCPNSAVNLHATPVGTVTPGPAAYSWSVLGGANIGNTQNVVVNPSVNTTYVVAMTGGACTHYDTVKVTIGSLNVSPAITNVKCTTQTNGKIVVTASNGVSPYSYTWSGNAATGNIDSAINLAAGVYTVTVNDVNSCSGTATATVTQPGSYPSVTFNLTPVKCFGGNNGTITATPNGGTTPYTYNWSNSLPATPGQTGLIAGTYYLTTSDANGCTVASTIPLTQPTQITFGAATIQNEKCSNSTTGKITVSVSGGTGATYGYLWSNNATTQTISNLAVGTYKVTVTDANFCTASASYNVTASTTISSSSTIIDSTKCFGSSDGSASVTAAGGAPPYTYLWSPGGQTTPTATGLSAQTYQVVITDDSLCSTTITNIVIPQPGRIQIAATASNISCNGANDGAIAITGTTNAHQPVTYLWSTTATTQAIANLSANTYRVTVTDANGCTAVDSFTITQPPVLVLNPATQTNVLCFNNSTGSLTANPAGGTGAFTYAWSNNLTTQTINNLAAATYKVTVTDARNCTVSGSYTITQPGSSPVFGNPTISNAACNGSANGSITVAVSGGTPGYTYSWSQNASLNNNTATNLVAGTYKTTVTDANGCSASTSNTINQPTPIVFAAPVVVNDSCHGSSTGSILVNVSGGAGSGFTYTWNGVAGPNPENGLPAGLYTIVATDVTGCTASATVTVSEPAPIQDSISIENVRCFGGADGALTVHPYGGNAPFTFVWSNGPTTAHDSLLAVAGSPYSVTITDNTGCTATDHAAITEPGVLTFTHSVTQVKCPGQQNGTITAVAQGGIAPYSFSVSKDGENFVNAPNGIALGLDSGLYNIYLSDNNGCLHVDTAFVPSPVADSFAVTVDSTSCYGSAYTDGSISLTYLVANNAPYTYTIDGGATQDTSYFANLGAGPHHIIATNQFGCTYDIDTVVSSPGQGYASVLPKDTTINLGQSITLFSGFGPFPPSAITLYNWVTSEGLSCIDCPYPKATPYSHVTEYVLTITYNNNCVATDSGRVIVINKGKFFVPNSFSPNGDGNNDVFTVYGEDIKTIVLRVFNRWGEVVFETNSQYAGWDGTYKGNLQAPAVFTYSAEITFLDDTRATKHGSITLIR